MNNIKPRIPTVAPYIPFVLNDGKTVLNHNLCSYIELLFVDDFELTACYAWRSHFRHNFIGVRSYVNCVPREVNQWYCLLPQAVHIRDRFLFTVYYKPFMTMRDYYMSLLKSDIYVYSGVKECDHDFIVDGWLTQHPDYFNAQFGHAIGGDNRYFEPTKIFDVSAGVVPLC